MNMKINKDKSIGRVLFIVEGGKTEFSLLQKIFCNVLGYEYIAKKRDKPDFFVSKNKSTSKVAVINTEESNISDVCDENCYLDKIFELLITKYNFQVDKAAIYYLFDRDPKSNVDIELIKNLISTLADPYENQRGERGGVLLLSYPSIESYIISSFTDDTHSKELALGENAKAFISSNNKIIQLNKITGDTIKKATLEMMKFFEKEKIELHLDDYYKTNMAVFDNQEECYSNTSKFKLISLLAIAFLQLGIIEL